MSASPEPVQVRMAEYPTGMPDSSTWSFSHDPLPPVREGNVRLRVSHLSIDPGMRGWITPKKSYMASVRPGETMRAFGVGEVVESSFAALRPGDWATGFTGVQTEAVLPGKTLRKIDVSLAPASAYLSGLGMTGYTAYFGLLDVGKPQRGETVVVSSAAGAVGSVASQIARLSGCKVVGIAGGPKKAAFLRDELRLDAAIDYKRESIPAALAAAAPEGVDLYFDNVGGPTLDAVLMQIKRHARIVVCGGISQYGDLDRVQGPSNYLQLVTQSARMQGFTRLDYLHRIPEASTQLLAWWQAGQLRFREHVVHGLESFPRALAMLLSGENHGKLLLELRSGA